MQKYISEAIIMLINYYEYFTSLKHIYLRPFHITNVCSRNQTQIEAKFTEFNI